MTRYVSYRLHSEWELELLFSTREVHLQSRLGQEVDTDGHTEADLLFSVMECKPSGLQGKRVEGPFNFQQKLPLLRALGKHSWSLGKRRASWMGFIELSGSTGILLVLSFLGVTWLEPLCCVSIVISEVWWEEYTTRLPERNVPQGKRSLVGWQSLDTLV